MGERARWGAVQRTAAAALAGLLVTVIVVSVPSMRFA